MRRNYQNLSVYQKALALAIETCNLSSDIQSLRLKEQMIGSSTSIPSNIAEGAERESNKFFYNFLNYASSSCAELFTQLTIISTIQQELKTRIDRLLELLDEVHRMIRGLMKKVKEGF